MRTPETTLYFVRHGESVANAGGITMEHASIPLTPRGRAQAMDVAQLLPADPTRILTSEFARARETAEPYCSRVRRVAEAHPLLNEFSAIDPATLQGMTGAQRRPIAQAYWDAADPCARKGAAAETFFEFDSRVGAFLEELPDICGNSVLFGHGIWFGLLCWRLNGRKVDSSEAMNAFRQFQQQMQMSHCGVYVLTGGPQSHWLWDCQIKKQTIG